MAQTSIAYQKPCNECGEVKNLSEFYVHAAMADGHLGKCKECVKKRVNAHRQANLERIRAYDRARGNRQSRDYARKHYLENKERVLSQKKAWLERNEHKRKAHELFGNAIRSGKIKPLPCQVCGSEKADGHHPDYSKPFDVMWLCRKHHAEEHRRLNEIKRSAK